MQVISIAVSLVLGIVPAHAFDLKARRMCRLTDLRIADRGSEEERQCDNCNRCQRNLFHLRVLIGFDNAIR